MNIGTFRVHINRSLFIWGTPYAANVNVKSQTKIITQHFTPKAKLLFDNQIPSRNTYYTNPLLPLYDYE